jgi:integrase/recombinase XerD
VSGPTTLLPFQPATMSTAQLAAVSYLARYSGRTHSLYAYQLGQWFAWCETNALDPLVGIQRAPVELYIRGLGDRGLMDSWVVTMMHAVRGYFRFAHIDGLIPSDPAVYARLPKVHRDESRTQGLDRLELIRFLQVAQTISVQARRQPDATSHELPDSTPVTTGGTTTSTPPGLVGVAIRRTSGPIGPVVVQLN